MARLAATVWAVGFAVVVGCNAAWAGELLATTQIGTAVSAPVGTVEVREEFREQKPATITITSGGGNKINERVVALFSKTIWRLNYPDAPEIEREANQRLAADGYEVEKRSARQGWWVETVVIGAPEQFVPRGDGQEETKAGFERGSRVVVGILAGVLGGASGFASGNIAGAPTANNPHGKYITKEMVEGVPPGAKKILLTRIVNPIYRAQQEVLTVAYTDVADEELRRINAGPLLEMIGLNNSIGR